MNCSSPGWTDCQIKLKIWIIFYVIDRQGQLIQIVAELYEQYFFKKF